jgi:hypothetical protein
MAFGESHSSMKKQAFVKRFVIKLRYRRISHQPSEKIFASAQDFFEIASTIASSDALFASDAAQSRPA